MDISSLYIVKTIESDGEMCIKKKFLWILVLFVPILLANCKPENQHTPTNHELGDQHLRDKDGMTMVYVPEGHFIMGSNELNLCAEASPEHDVSLNAFWIDRTEVTNAMFATFLNDQGNQINNGIKWLEPGAGHRGIVYGYIEERDGVYRTQEGYENHPVIEVSWYGAAAYCAWAGGRLPTEAEWEYSARGPERNQYPWGNTFDGERVNFCDKNCPNSWRDISYTDGAARWTAVGNYPEGASWCGALDMGGNVWEWVNDWWSDEYYSYSPINNPEGPDHGTLHIARGGSWYDEGWRMNSICRKGLKASSARMHWVGFRCVLPVDLEN